MDALPDDYAEELPAIIAGFDMAQAAKQPKPPRPAGERPLYGQGRGMAG